MTTLCLLEHLFYRESCYKHHNTILGQIADSSSTQTAEDISSALPVYWKYASIYDYDVSVSGSVISISKKDGSSISNLGITTLGDEFTEVIVVTYIYTYNRK